jgi:hypothetical protein
MVNSYLKPKLRGRSENVVSAERQLKRAGPLSGLSCLDYVTAVDCEGRTIFVADGHRHNGNRFVVRADEMLTAFMELESAVEPFSASSFL